jgi:hypothetical protein
MSSREALLQAFRLTAADIAANRAGRLGPAQQHNLRTSGNLNIAGVGLLGLLLITILYGVAAHPLVPIQWILSVLGFVIVLLVSMRYFQQTRAAIALGRVEALIGQVHVRSRGYAGWYLAVAGQSFRLPIRPWHIQQDAIYRVYIVPSTQTIVAMEPAPDGTLPI